MLVTHAHLAEALAALREDVRGEILAALEAERRGSSPQGPALASKAVPAGEHRVDFSSWAPRDAPGPRGRTVAPEPAADRPPSADRAAEEAPPGQEGGELAKLAEAAAEEEEEEFAFQESMWDAAVFIGSGKLGLFGSIFTTGALLVNMAMQISMCLIINDALTQPPMSENDIQELEYWRTTVAQNIKYVDQFSWETLARRICEGGDAPMSASASSALDAINEYMPTSEDRVFMDEPPMGYWAEWEGESVGKILCCFALLIWWSTVLREVFSVVDMTKAVRLLPKGKTAFSTTDKGYKLEAVSAPRRCLIGAIVLLRAFICVPLFMCGTLYLVSTISLGDLILNAVALEIVLTLDEVVFSVLAPVSARKLIKSMEPLPAGRIAACRGLDAKPIFAMLFCMAAMVFSITVHLGPQVEILGRARGAICDGNLDFVAGIDKSGMVFASAPDPDIDLETTSTYVYRAIRHLIEDEEAAEEGSQATGRWLTTNWWQGVSGGHWSVESMVELPVEKVSEVFNYDCRDADRSDFDDSRSDFWRVAAQILQDSSGVATISSCEDVASYCDMQKQAGVLARQYCPETCGCDDPTSNLTLLSAQLGCPKICRTSDLYHAKLGDLKCADFSPEEPQMINGTDVMAVFLSGEMGSWMRYYGVQFESAMHEGGCPAAVSTLRDSQMGDLCQESNNEGLRPITLLCPETCRCDQSGALLCPPACGLT